uniref:Serine-threonine protein kinase, plant-type n=1 Tax=Solanum tuberosum TaxID=4113 RepID=M1B3F3_SOLTU
MLFISDNPIKGTIPTSLGNISSLHYFNCGNNHIVEQIPPELGKLSNLRQLILDNNHNLIGQIPEAIFNISSLEVIGFNINNLSGRIPTTTGLHLGGNQLEGEIPLFITNASELQIISLDDNSLTETIPNNLGNLRELQILLLHTNQLTNEPRERSIPVYLEKLSYLQSINVSFNDLEGVIPSSGVFANTTLQSFLGNKGLCGVHILDIPACAVTNPGKQSKLKEGVLKIVTPVVISSFLIFLLVSIWIMKRQKKGKSKDVEKGISGSVYKGTLFGGTAVAIKGSGNLENEKVCRRFDTKCEVMRNVRHRNLVPVITTCSSDYIRAFVLRYMPNGSLENWLYREESQLNLLQRVTVMLDAAMAVEYLHHGHVTPIVHYAIKPSNALLDEDIVAHVGDFGISKILAVSKSMAHTETLGTLGYIAPGIKNLL